MKVSKLKNMEKNGKEIKERYYQGQRTHIRLGILIHHLIIYIKLACSILKGRRELKNLECSINFDGRGKCSSQSKGKRVLSMCDAALGFCGFLLVGAVVVSFFWACAGGSAGFHMFSFVFSLVFLCILLVYFGALNAFYDILFDYL